MVISRINIRAEGITKIILRSNPTVITEIQTDLVQAAAAVVLN